jgi:hypothetical protein
MSKELIQQWVEDGSLSLKALVHDFVAGGHLDVQNALSRYRNKLGFLESYQQPYDTLDIFLTMYGAYSVRSLVYNNARLIAHKCIHPKADIRQSVPDPGCFTPALSVAKWAQQAAEEMQHIGRCLLPEQRLVITFPRQTFTCNKHFPHFKAFIELLRNRLNSITRTTAESLSDDEQPWFDFSGQEVRVDLTLPMLRHIRKQMPRAHICYHHGELCQIPLEDRVEDALKLLPLIDRLEA